VRTVHADGLDTPLCPLQGHLPRKGGEGRLPLRRVFKSFVGREEVESSDVRTKKRALPLAPVSPLAGEMSAAADRGGYTALVENAEFQCSNWARQMPHREISKRLRANARTLRSGMTDAEKVLWRAQKAHRLEGISFRRQMPIEGYIVDFAAPGHRIVVEVDGSQHGDEPGLKSDQVRDQRLRELGWTVLRFWNNDVLTNLDGVCRKILDACGKEQF